MKDEGWMEGSMSWLTCGSESGEIGRLRHSNTTALQLKLDGRSNRRDPSLSLINFCYTKVCSPQMSLHQSGKRPPSPIGLPRPLHENER
jgi:hypothetical protein